MDALLHRFHNFVLLLMRGEDGVCACTCGRDQVYRVIPYDEAQSMEASRENFIMTHQEMNVLAGLVSGLCICWFWLQLDRVRLLGLKYWKANRMSDVGFWPRFPKFSISNMRNFFRQLNLRHTEDSREKQEQEVYHVANDSM